MSKKHRKAPYTLRAQLYPKSEGYVDLTTLYQTIVLAREEAEQLVLSGAHSFIEIFDSLGHQQEMINVLTLQAEK